MTVLGIGTRYETATSLLTLPATSGQRRWALAAIAVLFVAFAATAPFGTIRLRESDGFVPAVQAIIFVTDLTTAALLFTQFSLTRSRALLTLASAYLFTALIVVVHTLAFPRAFTPEGLLGASIQTTGWLYVVWHFSFPAAVIAYVLLKDEADAKGARASPRTAVWWSVIGVAALVGGILWFLTAADAFLPPLFLDGFSFSPLVLYIGGFVTLVCAVALLLLLRPKGSLLDQWLAVSVAAMTVEVATVTFFLGGRFDLGWYALRIFAVISSTAVLLALLTEIMRLYAKLATAFRSLERERDNKLLSAQAAATAIAHELRQPLAAITAEGGTALAFLEGTPPDLDEVRTSLDSIINGCCRANDTLDGIRSLFHTVDRSGQPIDLNEVILEVMQSQQEQATRRRVEIRHELAAGLPLVRGHRAQLQEVVINLVNNALEAMASSNDRNRLLKVRTDLRGSDGIAVEIQDNGPGIDPKRLDGVFEAFVTTKPNGTGLGLAISRMIIDHHGGKLTVSSDGQSGAAFQFVLPVMDPDGARAA